MSREKIEKQKLIFRQNHFEQGVPHINVAKWGSVGFIKQIPGN